MLFNNKKSIITETDVCEKSSFVGVDSTEGGGVVILILWNNSSGLSVKNDSGRSESIPADSCQSERFWPTSVMLDRYLSFHVWPLELDRFFSHHHNLQSNPLSMFILGFLQNIYNLFLITIEPLNWCLKTVIVYPFNRFYISYSLWVLNLVFKNSPCTHNFQGNSSNNQKSFMLQTILTHA